MPAVTSTSLLWFRRSRYGTNARKTIIFPAILSLYHVSCPHLDCHQLVTGKVLSLSRATWDLSQGRLPWCSLWTTPRRTPPGSGPGSSSAAWSDSGAADSSWWQHPLAASPSLTDSEADKASPSLSRNMGLCIELEGNPDKDKIETCPLDSSHAAATGREDSDEVVTD